jgi:hypothetical protein
MVLLLLRLTNNPYLLTFGCHRGKLPQKTRPQGRRVKTQGAGPQKSWPLKGGAGRRTRAQGAGTALLGPQKYHPAPTRHPDPPQIKVYHPPWSSLPRRKWHHHAPNMQHSKRLDEVRHLLRCSWLLLIHTKTTTHPKPYARLERRRHGRFQSSLRSTSLVSSALSCSKSLLLVPCSSVMSLYCPSIKNACGYCFCNKANLAVISSLES